MTRRIRSAQPASKTRGSWLRSWLDRVGHRWLGDKRTATNEIRATRGRRDSSRRLLIEQLEERSSPTLVDPFAWAIGGMGFAFLSKAMLESPAMAGSNSDLNGG